jgi:hypothetical protein
MNFSFYRKSTKTSLCVAIPSVVIIAVVLGLIPVYIRSRNNSGNNPQTSKTLMIVYFSLFVVTYSI